MPTREAIETWHALLTDEVAAESQARLDEEQVRRGMYFGERPLCSVLRPRFLSHAEYRAIRAGVEVLLGAFGRAHLAAVEDAQFRAQFHLLDWEERLVHDDPGFASPSPTSRLDAFFDPEAGSLLFTEYNAETPAAPAYMDLLSDVFLALPVMGRFLQSHVVHPLPARHGVLHALLTAYRQFTGRPRELPRIGILDWKEVPTYSEFVFFRDYFESHGLACTIADPREVEYVNGRLMAGDFHVTLIYKRVLIDELVDRMGMDSPVVRAVRDGAVCMVNPFRCKILYKKASLAVLGDERNARLFTPEELKAISAHVPWTRVVEERKTLHRGIEIDLVPWIAQNREWLVLKPNDDYGGRGIVLGWTVGQEEWDAALRTALTTPYVVQERIMLPREPYPSVVDGRVLFTDRMLDLAPFVTHGTQVDGCLTRLSTDPLLNVTAGGGSSVATMLVEKR